MAIRLEDEYPAGRINPADASYPAGSIKNEVTPGVSNDGTPLDELWGNDREGFYQALLNAASIAASGVPDTVLLSDYMSSLTEIVSGRVDNYDESGVADAYVLDVRTNQHGPKDYFDGMRIVFTPGNNNAGASTVDVNGIGIKQLRDESDVALVGGELVTTKRATATYSTVTGRFSLTTSALGGSAANTAFDNTSTGMTASDVQAAIDEGIGANQNRVLGASATFDGSGTVAILESFNVTSITDNGPGDFTFNFTVSFAGINYTAALSCELLTGNLLTVVMKHDTVAATVSAFRVKAQNQAGGLIDPNFVYGLFFGDR